MRPPPCAIESARPRQPAARVSPTPETVEASARPGAETMNKRSIWAVLAGDLGRHRSSRDTRLSPPRLADRRLPRTPCHVLPHHHQRLRSLAHGQAGSQSADEARADPWLGRRRPGTRGRHHNMEPGARLPLVSGRAGTAGHPPVLARRQDLRNARRHTLTFTSGVGNPA